MLWSVGPDAEALLVSSRFRCEMLMLCLLMLCLLLFAGFIGLIRCPVAVEKFIRGC